MTEFNSLIDEAWKHLNGKSPDDAVSIGQQLVERGHSSGYEILGRAYRQLGELDKAIDIVQEGVSVAPSVWLLWNLLGNCYSDSGAYERAHSCFQEALKCTQVDVSVVMLNQAIACFREGDLNRAAKRLEVVQGDHLHDQVEALRRHIAEASELEGLPGVWFFLVEVKALEGGAIYAPDSIVLLQCLIPQRSLEQALVSLDAFLAEERYERLDLSIARRYRPGDREDTPPDTVSELIPRVAQSGRPEIALHIHAREDAALLDPPTADATAPEQKPPSKPWWRKFIQQD